MNESNFMSQWWRVGGVLGIGFIILFLVAGFGIQGESPTYDDSIDEIRAYWEDDGNTYLVGDFLLGIASMVFLLPFIVCLGTLLRMAEGEPAIWSRVGFYGGLFVIAFAAMASASWTALAFAAENLGDDSLLTLMYLDVGAWNAFPYAIGVWVTASSLVMVMTGALWRWLGWLGLVIGIAAFIAPLGILDEDPEDVFDIIGFIPFIGLAIWVVAAAIGMIMKREAPVPAVQRQM